VYGPGSWRLRISTNGDEHNQGQEQEMSHADILTEITGNCHQALYLKGQGQRSETGKSASNV
jgi:hypothetical protein